MHFTLFAAGALLPGELAIALTASLNTPTLKSRLSRATCAERPASSVVTGAHFGWLASTLFGQDAPAPTAPYAYAQTHRSSDTQGLSGMPIRSTWKRRATI